MLSFEDQARKNGYSIIIGIDEAGRGPLAGPVVSSAVCLKKTSFDSKITDSKKISEKLREKAFNEIQKKAYIGIGVIGEKVIDRIGILNATYRSMNYAIEQLLSKMINENTKISPTSICLLIDGNSFQSKNSFFYQTIVKGDSKSFSIACASIVAKVTRDAILKIYHQKFPEYNLEGHKGYPTKAHKEAIRQFGFSPIHRKTFRV
jgi:ribonuclease HII